MSKILIIDDELEICKQVSSILNKNSFKTSYVVSYDEYSKLKDTNFDFDLVLVDLWLKNSSKQGIDIIKELKNNYSNLVIISFSGHANIDNAIESVKAGANDFIEKPFETKKLLHIIQKNLLELKQKVTINNYRNQISFHTKINNIGFSDYIDNFFIKANKIKSNSSIYLYGPRGTGKNYFANYIHMKLSSNNPDTFINMNENLLNENDLLKFSSLHNYFTIYFNDFDNFNKIEILNYFNLVKFNKINASIIIDSRNSDFDVNLINNIDYKFKFIPLIERKNEIFPLFKHYLNIFTKKKFEKNVSIDPLIENFLINYNWPGNIFEVMNVAQNLVNDMISPPDIIMIDEIKKMLDSSPINSDLYDLNYKEAKEKFERDFLIQKLKNNNWNMTLTSKLLNLDRVSLYRKLKTLNIKID
jgi:two-component system nitrogen regulation response regulator NtrX